MKKRVMVIYGTRPEAVKMAPLVKALQVSPVLEPVVVSTGQHRAMMDQVNDWFGISPMLISMSFGPTAASTTWRLGSSQNSTPCSWSRSQMPWWSKGTPPPSPSQPSLASIA